jgi:hypothetical protein
MERIFPRLPLIDDKFVNFTQISLERYCFLTKNVTNLPKLLIGEQNMKALFAVICTFLMANAFAYNCELTIIYKSDLETSIPVELRGGASSTYTYDSKSCMGFAEFYIEDMREVENASNFVEAVEVRFFDERRGIDNLFAKIVF